MLGDAAKQGTTIKGTVKEPIKTQEPMYCVNCLDAPATHKLTVETLDGMALDSIVLCRMCLVDSTWFLGDEDKLQEY